MKKILKVICSLSLVFGLFMSCADITENADSAKSENSSHINSYAIENINSEIVLGEKFENPFTVEQVNARNAADGIEELVEANYIYFRCRTNDEAAQKWLSEKFDFLSIIPLDREILEGGTIYKDPELAEGEAPWFYLMKPIEDYKEVVEYGLITEILDKMYLDDEDIALLSAEGLEIPEDTYLTVNPEEESARFGGWLVKKIKKFVQKYVANYPKGYVKVYDTVKQEYVPVKGIKVMSQQLGVAGTDITNKSGHFSIPRAYTSLGYKVQIILQFENSDITVNSPEHLSNALGSVTYYEDWHWIEGISDLNIKIGKGQFNERCATILNAYSDYCDYCDQNNIKKPKNLSIWTVSKTPNACTPLLRHSLGVADPSLNNSLTNFLGISIPSLDRAIIPDVIIGTKNATDKALTKNIYSNMFHELSHASHYFGLGTNAKKIWYREYGDMLAGWVKTGLRGESPLNNTYNNGGTDLVKLIESWGYFSENYIMAWKYPEKTMDVYRKNGNKTEKIKISPYYDNLENRKLDIKGDGEKDKSKPYFYYGGFYDLIDCDNIEYDDEGNPSTTIVDFCSGYKYRELFNALTSSNVTNLNTFANALVKVTNRKSDLQNVIKTLNANHD